MESTRELIMQQDVRFAALRHWLTNDLQLSVLNILPLMGDASFRRYFRVRTQNGSFIAMDSPLQLENCAPFIAIAKALAERGLIVPRVFHANLEAGFLLLTDFGDQTYLSALTADNANLLYQRALKALATLQNTREVPDRIIPPFTGDFMWQEWAWHKHWFLQKWLQLDIDAIEPTLDECFAYLVASALEQPQVFMHRDYHSGNLMVLENTDKVGILDFQDAFIGPITYDLVSLLRDCYIDWPKEQVERWMNYYLSLLKAQQVVDVNTETFLQWFDLMGIERHIKALFTFSRKALRDDDKSYLRFVPRTLQYITAVSNHYKMLGPMTDFYQQTVATAVKKVLP